MKKALISILALGCLQVQAQKTSITDIDTNSKEDTTISIQKGARPNADKAYEFVDGTGDIDGDPNVLKNVARDNWKKACTDWKKEIKDMNKDNQVLVLNCNSPECKTEASGTSCKSTGTYKLKVKVVR
jgi:hypothetical protein